MNEAQGIHLQNTLLALDKTLYELKALLGTPDVTGALFFWINPLKKHQKEKAEGVIRQIESDLKQLAHRFGWTTAREDLLGQIQGHLHMHWTRLEDARPKSLKHYGEVDQATQTLLDPALDQLTDRVNELLKTLIV